MIGCTVTKVLFRLMVGLQRAAGVKFAEVAVVTALGVQS